MVPYIISEYPQMSAKEALALACKKLDKAVAKGFLHKNNAARHKSTLCKKVNSL
jgi:small subunit ribosomal protein S20